MSVRSKACVVLSAAAAVYVLAGAGAMYAAGVGVIKWLGAGGGLIAVCAGGGVGWAVLNKGAKSESQGIIAMKAGIRATYLYLALVCIVVLRKADMLIPARRVLMVVAGVVMVQAVAWAVAVLVGERSKRAGKDCVDGDGGV